MSRKQNQSSDSSQGAPEWMVTFSDCMTLLLTFFVLLLSFSTLDDKTYKNLKLIFNTSFSSIGLKTKSIQQSMAKVDLIKHTKKIDEGVEKPSADTGKQGALRHTPLPDITQYTVFLANSGDIFWANGNVISTSGEKTLSTLAKLLEYIPNRVLISESSINKTDDITFGLSRAYAVMNHLVKNHNINKNRFGILANHTIEKKNIANVMSINENDKNNRILEITLFEWSI